MNTAEPTAAILQAAVILQADPNAAVQVGADRHVVRTRTADAEAKARLWAEMARS